MNPTDPRAAEVWSHTLNALRQERRRRRVRATIFAGAAVFLLLAAVFFQMEPSSTTVALAEPTATRLPDPAAGMDHPALAVLVIRDGMATLEALSAGDLPDAELRLSLDPILTDYRELAEERF